MIKKENLYNNLKKNKLIKFILIPCILLLVWIFASLFFNTYIGFTSLTQNYSNNILIKAPKGELLKEQKIIGKFKVNENNLGIIFLQFAPRKQVVDEDQDILVFKIKEKDSQNWWYQNTYKSNAIAGMSLFPFGFPIVTNSKDKTFIFEITSLSGNGENALQLGSNYPMLISKYVFSKSELLANKEQFIQFIIKKFIYSFTDIYFWAASLIYLLPLIFYLLWIGVFEKVKKEKNSFLLFMPLLIIIAIFFHIDLLGAVFYALILFWIIIINEYKVESSISFLFGGLFFFLAFCAILYGHQELGGRLSNWTYVFLAIGAVQLIGELKNPSGIRLTYDSFLRSLITVFKINKKNYKK